MPINTPDEHELMKRLENKHFYKNSSKMTIFLQFSKHNFRTRQSLVFQTKNAPAGILLTLVGVG